jgi:hypothetical protein
VVSRGGPGENVSAAAAQIVAAGRRVARLEQARPLHVLSGLIVAEWLVTLGVALVVRHNGWLYYQGGDQLWHYVTAWVIGHGRLPHTSVGFAWAIVLLPFALIGGPNMISPLPFIVLLNVLVLMPVAMLATYGIGNRIGGRLFGYFATCLWVLVPLAGIKFTDAGYHQRYTELLVPQSLGLTAMSDFPSMVVSAVSAYFALRAIDGDEPWDGVLAGLFAGVALGIKPSNAPLLVGIGLALLAARRARALAALAAGLAPGLLTLALWKARGEGNLPLFRGHAALPGRLVTAHAAPVLGLTLNHYIHPSWSYLQMQLHDLGQYMWSVRILEWLAIGGTIGLLRRSRPLGLLFGGWFFSNVLAKWMTPGRGTIADSDLLRQSIPTIPAALFLIAGIVLLYPGLPQRLQRPALRPFGTHRARVALAAATLALFFVVPAALAVGLPVLSDSDTLSYYTQTGASLSAPFTVDSGWHATVTNRKGSIRVSWPALHPLGASMGYLVFRSRPSDVIVCDETGGGSQCRLGGIMIAATRGTTATEHIPPGVWVYRVAASASWTDVPTAGNIFVVGPPVTIKVGR